MALVKGDVNDNGGINAPLIKNEKQNKVFIGKTKKGEVDFVATKNKEKQTVKKHVEDIKDGFKFVKTIIPGDVLDITVTKTRDAGTLKSFDAKVMVDGQVRAKGSMTFTAVPKSEIYPE